MIRNCIICGAAFRTFPSLVKRGFGLYCNRKCKGVGERSAKSLGEVDGYNVYVGTNGYARIVFGRSNEKLFHVYVMEKYLGRKLEKNEHVHHLNDNKLDNRIENLAVLSNLGGHQREHAKKRLLALGGRFGFDKYCPACNTVKVLEDFPTSKSSGDGYHGFCKACSCAKVTAYRQLHKEKINAMKREAYSKKKGL